MLIYLCRRAKLKRLTTDDQERMRRSRALPEDFDFSQTLHPTIRETRPLYGSALTDPLILGGGTSHRPGLRLGTDRLGVASNSMESIFTNNLLSPVSATGSGNPSPVSSISEGSERSGPYFSATQSPLAVSPHVTNPFGRSHSLSEGSPAFQRQDRPSSHHSMMGLGGQSVVNTSPSNLSLANNTQVYGILPPLQFPRAPFQTQDGQRFGRMQPTEGFSHDSSIAMNQHYVSSNTQSYDQSQMLYPSGSANRASSYYQGPDTNLWQGSPMNPRGYQYGQQLQPHSASEQRRGSQSSQSPLYQDPSVNRHDEHSYSHGGEHYSRMGSPSDPNDRRHQPTLLGEEAATGPETQARPDAARPRARSDTFPAYYNVLS